MGSYKKIGLSHETGLIDTPPFKHIYCKIFGTEFKEEIINLPEKGLVIKGPKIANCSLSFC